MTSEEACTGMAASSMVEYAELPADLLSSFHADPNDGFDEIALPLHFTDFMLRPDGAEPWPRLSAEPTAMLDWNHACDAPQQPHTWFDNAALMSHSHHPRNGALAGGASASCLVGTAQVSAAPACAPVAPRRVTRDTAAPPPAAPARAGGVRAAKEAGTRKGGKGGSGKAEKRKAVRSTSKFRGVTHHCRTGRWEAHIWEEGKQLYLGGFDSEEQAALAYDIAAVKCRQTDAVTNYPLLNYQMELANLQKVTKEELVLSLRRQSKGFSRGTSRYRGVTRHQKGRWEARIGQLVGKKYRYLGLYDNENEAAQAYDREAVRQKGNDAITNFDIAQYDVEALQRTTDAMSTPPTATTTTTSCTPTTTTTSPAVELRLGPGAVPALHPVAASLVEALFGGGGGRGAPVKCSTVEARQEQLPDPMDDAAACSKKRTRAHLELPTLTTHRQAHGELTMQRHPGHAAVAALPTEPVVSRHLKRRITAPY